MASVHIQTPIPCLITNRLFFLVCLSQKHSLRSLHLLCGSLHAAILTLLPRDQDQQQHTPFSFVVKESAVFNNIVVSCFQQVPSCLEHHIPHTSSGMSGKVCLPTSQDAWTRVRRTVKQYLFDLLSLVETLQDTDMQSAVLKQISSMAAYFVCFPKLLKRLNRCLVEKWATGENHLQVLAFLALRRVLLFQSHPALHTLLKVNVIMLGVHLCYFPP